MRREVERDSNAVQRHPTKLFCAVSFLLICGVVLALAWFPGRPQPGPMSTARFLSRTNGVPNGEVSYLSSASAGNAQAIRRWLDTGTNAAAFRITNRNRWPIHVFPAARFDARGSGGGTPVFTPLLSASSYYGHRIEPGRSAVVIVALFPHDRDWRIEFDYVPADDGVFHPLWAARDAVKEIVRKVSGLSLGARPEVLRSDWVAP